MSCGRDASSAPRKSPSASGHPSFAPVGTSFTRLSMSQPTMKIVLCAFAIALRTAPKYCSPSTSQLTFRARSMRQQVRPGTSRLVACLGAMSARGGECQRLVHAGALVRADVSRRRSARRMLRSRRRACQTPIAALTRLLVSGNSRILRPDGARPARWRAPPRRDPAPPRRCRERERPGRSMM